MLQHPCSESEYTCFDLNTAIFWHPKFRHPNIPTPLCSNFPWFGLTYVSTPLCSNFPHPYVSTPLCSDIIMFGKPCDPTPVCCDTRMSQLPTPLSSHTCKFRYTYVLTPLCSDTLKFQYPYVPTLLLEHIWHLFSPTLSPPTFQTPLCSDSSMFWVWHLYVSMPQFATSLCSTICSRAFMFWHSY